MDCIFCRIIKGEIPCYKVYEDEHVFAFLDISQVTKGHTLIIPKTHVKNIYELDEEAARNVFQALPKISRALERAFHPIGMNIIINTDKPLQSVYHLHIHLIPRYEGDGLTIQPVRRKDPVTDEEFRECQLELSKELQS